MDPGMISPQELVQADNVQFSSTGARIKREALEYLDLPIAAPDYRSSSGTTRYLRWDSNVIVSNSTSDERLVVGEKIAVTGGISDYDIVGAPITSITIRGAFYDFHPVADVSGSLAGKYFTVSAGDLGINYYVWFKVSGIGTDPSLAGYTGIEIDLSTNDVVGTVGAAIVTALNATAAFTCAYTVLSGTPHLTIDTTTNGFAIHPTLGTSGFTFNGTQVYGSVEITYEAPNSLSEAAFTPANGIVVTRSSAVIMVKDYWRFSGGENTPLLVYATNDFQLFRLDTSGRRQQIHGQPQVTSVTCLAGSGITGGHYFLVDGGNEVGNMYVWYTVDSVGSDPHISDRTGIEVDILSTDADTAVASNTAATIAAFTSLGYGASASGNGVTITNPTAGVCAPADAGNSGFTVSVATYGATLPVSQIERIRTNVFNERLQIYFSTLGDYPIIYNPDDNANYQLMGQNPSTGLTMPDASFAFNFLSRVWTDDKNDPDLLNYSETFDETLWLGNGDSGGLPVYPGDGDPQGITNAYPYKGFIVVAKKDARYRVDGDTPEDFQVNQISQGMGNEGSLAIAVDEIDVVFISKRGVHSQQVTDTYGDTEANYLSFDIKPTFLSWEPAALANIQGTYIPELNSFALAIQEQGQTSQKSVWLFNTQVQVPGKQMAGAWYRWPNLSCTALSRQYTNNIHKLIFGTVDGRVARAQKANNYSDFGTEGINYLIKTGAIYPGNDQQIMKAFKRLTLIYRPQGNFTYSVNAKVDNQQVQGFTFNQVSGLDLLGETFRLGTSLLGASNVLAPYSLTMDGYGRGVTLTITQPSANEQIELWGYAIEWESADLAEETV